MADYYARAHSEPAQAQPAPIPPKKNLKFGLTQLAQRYGVMDMTDFSSDGSSGISAEQTIDEEFLTYTTVTFEHRDISDADILAFWEVSTLAAAALLCLLASDDLTMQCGGDRQMNLGFQHYLPSHLTISLSRLRQFHVSESSLQVGKRTQSNATESIQCSWKHFKCSSFL
jgi:hypothetical protein